MIINHLKNTLTMILRVRSLLYLSQYLATLIISILFSLSFYKWLSLLHLLQLPLSWRDRFFILILDKFRKHLIINSRYLVRQLQKLHFNQIPFLVNDFLVLNDLSLTQHWLTHHLRKNIVLPGNGINQFFIAYKLI